MVECSEPPGHIVLVDALPDDLDLEPAPVHLQGRQQARVSLNMVTLGRLATLNIRTQLTEAEAALRARSLTHAEIVKYSSFDKLAGILCTQEQELRSARAGLEAKEIARRNKNGLLHAGPRHCKGITTVLWMRSTRSMWPLGGQLRERGWRVSALLGSILSNSPILLIWITTSCVVVGASPGVYDPSWPHDAHLHADAASPRSLSALRSPLSDHLVSARAHCGQTVPLGTVEPPPRLPC